VVLFVLMVNPMRDLFSAGKPNANQTPKQATICSTDASDKAHPMLAKAQELHEVSFSTSEEEEGT
tara:strand:- start:1106 stop:1300 length:195 start_codon:yes stop_codon:yes gene_type:complete